MTVERKQVLGEEKDVQRLGEISES